MSPLLNNPLQPFTFERMCVRLTCLCVLIAVACVHALKGVGHPNTRMPLSCYATALEEMGKLDPRVAGGEEGRAGGAKRKRATGEWEGLVERSISHILWPSRLTIASRMQVAALLTNLRALPAKVWNNIPTDAKNRLFFDAPPPLFPAGAPSAQAVAAGARPSPVAHAKVFFAEMPRIATLYVG